MHMKQKTGTTVLWKLIFFDLKILFMFFSISMSIIYTYIFNKDLSVRVRIFNEYFVVYMAVPLGI